MRPDEFGGKFALVTGAASGIGRATAWMVAEHGGAVGCLDLDESGLRETCRLIADKFPQTTVKWAVADVSDAAQVDAALVTIDFSQVDLLCNIAGVNRNKPLLSCSTDDLLLLMRVNVGSVVTMTSAVAPRMPRGSVVINTSSSATHKVVMSSGLYAASKKTIDFLTRFYAQELAEQGVRACTVSPGGVDTPMPRGQAAALGITDSEEIRRRLQETRLITPIAEPEEIATAIGFLASQDARYCTGMVLEIDGGTASK